MKTPHDGWHIITLESEIQIDEATNTVRFHYWTGGQPKQPFSTTVNDVMTHFRAFVEATF
jgi:hypothetical protein